MRRKNENVKQKRVNKIPFQERTSGDDHKKEDEVRV